MHWFCSDDLSYCVCGITRKYTIAKPLVPTIWFIQEGINLTQKEVMILKEVGFYFHRNHVRSLFGSQSFSPNSLHVPIMSAHNIVQLVDASYWFTIHGGKKVK